MKVEIAQERIVVLADRFNLDHAEGRAWARRAEAFGTVARLGGLLGRSNVDDYECVYRERRLQPFWRLHARSSAEYERTRTYTVAVAPEVHVVEIAGQSLTTPNAKFQLEGLESCREQAEREFLYDGLTRAESPALQKYLAFAGTVEGAEVLADAARQRTVVVPPENKASMLVREVVSATIGKIEADRVLSEEVSVDVVDLVYRPVYAFRYAHGGKTGVIEFDGLTGEIRPDGTTFEQYLGKALEPRFLLDVGVEAVNLFVPGTQLARIVVEHGVKRITEQRRDR